MPIIIVNLPLRTISPSRKRRVSMTLQILEYFIAVAQHRNFTKAAQACHVSQPALSRAIRGLEEELGCPLLIRSGRTATLTPEGEVCLAEVKQVLQQCAGLKQKLREVGWKNQPPLRVGYVMRDYLKDFMQRVFGGTDPVPSIRIETVYDIVANVRQSLISGEMDVAILPEACIVGLEDVEYRYLLKGPLHVIVHTSHPFSERTEIYLEELRDQPLVIFKETLFRTGAIHVCVEAGIVPNIVAEGEKLGDLLAQVRLHNAVGIGSALFGAIDINDYRGIPIVDGPERFGSVCVWRRKNQSPILEELKRLLEAFEEP